MFWWLAFSAKEPDGNDSFVNCAQPGPADLFNFICQTCLIVMASSAMRLKSLDALATDSVPSTSYPVPRRRCWHAAPKVQVSDWKATSCRASTTESEFSTEPVRLADPVYMKEYQQLKDNMLATARKAGGGLAAYLLITVDGEAGLCALIGSAACNLYLLWLYRDIDSLTPDTKVPMWEAEKVQGGFARGIAKVWAGYGAALQPRLLVFVGLAASSWLWNQLSGSPLDTAHQGFLLLGFLSYKIPLVIKIADDNLSKNYKSDEMSRPLIERFDDNLDQFGRVKKQLVPLPTDALPDAIDTSNLPVMDLSKMSFKDVLQMTGLQKPDKQQDQEQDGGEDKARPSRSR